RTKPNPGPAPSPHPTPAGKSSSHPSHRAWQTPVSRVAGPASPTDQSPPAGKHHNQPTSVYVPACSTTSPTYRSKSSYRSHANQPSSNYRDLGFGVWRLGIPRYLPSTPPIHREQSSRSAGRG